MKDGDISSILSLLPIEESAEGFIVSVKKEEQRKLDFLIEIELSNLKKNS